MNLIGDYNKIMSDRNLFNKVVYTTLSDAILLLKERQQDHILMSKIEKLLNNNIPECLINYKNSAVMCRQISTPNYDVRSFISIAKDNNLFPIFYEFTDDKFTAENDYKHSLGQLVIHSRLDKVGNFIEEKINIIDFNKYNGKKLKDVKTLNNEFLLDFHRRLFNIYNIDLNSIGFLNGSDWVKKNGGSAKSYYKNLMLLFICHGILFENFMMNGTEGEFSAQTLLPAIDEIFKLTGLKPIIVPIPPMDLEEDSHWISHEPIIKQLILTK